MEREKNNSAIEKTEEISGTQNKESAVNHTRTGDYAYNNGDAYSDKVKREQMRIERDERIADRRAKERKMKEEKAAKKARAEAERRQNILRHRDEVAAEKARLREEKAARKEALKAETNERRNKRLQADRNERYRLEREKAEIRAELLAAKRADKKALKQKKMEKRAENRAQRRSRGLGGWIAAVVILGCTTLLLGTILTFNRVFDSYGDKILNNMYARAYYDLAGYVDNMDVSLSKVSVSNSPAEQQKLLADLAVQSSLAENELQTLPIEDSLKFSTSRYINQVGDYSKSLLQKIAGGEQMDEQDRATIREFARRNANLQSTLSTIKQDMGNNYSFTSMTKMNEDDAFTKNMGELEELSTEYPKMIYDGPFSDGLDRTETKGLTGREITEDEAVAAFTELFADYGLTDIKALNESYGDIETYNVRAMTQKGAEIYAQMAKRGGMPVLMNCYEDCSSSVFNLDECREIAEVFLKKAGFEGMVPVWQTASRAVAQFNFAYEEDGVIVYSDLVKVNVCMERGLVSSIEAATYCYNHTQRVIEPAAISAEQARQKVSGEIDVQAVRKVIVPVNSGEKLAYEVFGTFDDSVYYVYVDAKTGNEIEIFRVIESTEGTLLI